MKISCLKCYAFKFLRNKELVSPESSIAELVKGLLQESVVQEISGDGVSSRLLQEGVVQEISRDKMRSVQDLFLNRKWIESKLNRIKTCS